MNKDELNKVIEAPTQKPENMNTSQTKDWSDMTKAEQAQNVQAHYDKASKANKAQHCEWFALCDNEATTTRKHSILGNVPICERCNNKMEAI